MKYNTPVAGEWIQPIPRGYKMCCCDCGLVHKMDFRIVRSRKTSRKTIVQFRAYIDSRATGQARRHRKKP